MLTRLDGGIKAFNEGKQRPPPREERASQKEKKQVSIKVADGPPPSPGGVKKGGLKKQGTMAKLAEMVGLRQSTADEEEAPAPAPNRLLASLKKSMANLFGGQSDDPAPASPEKPGGGLLRALTKRFTLGGGDRASSVEGGEGARRGSASNLQPVSQDTAAV